MAILWSYMILTLIAFIVQTSAEPIVTVEQGQLLGKTIHFDDDYLKLNRSIDVYEGVPYAEPPAGSRRLMPPVPKGNWDGVYNATYIRDICLQYNSEAEGFAQSEDCLYLNIYVNNPMPVDAPVMIFFHGGGFDTGYGYMFNGIPLAAVGDVIVITLNYRLGPFGFLTAGDETFSGNYGMLDQVEALRWVHTNINAFGGDKNQVTLFGESAGASSSSAHLFSKLSHDLFNQVILESGGIFAPSAFHNELEPQVEMAYRLGVELGCSTTTSAELLECLQKVDAIGIKETAASLGFDGKMTVDGVFLPEHPSTMLANGDFKRCPIISGTNKDEGSLFVLAFSDDPKYNSTEPPNVSAEEFDNGLRTQISGYKNELIIDSFKQEYVDWTEADDEDADYYNAYSDVIGDDRYRCPASLELRAHALIAEYDLYQYYFTHSPSKSNLYWYMEAGPTWLGAAHTEELQFVFGYPFYPPFFFDGYEFPEEEKQLSLNFLKYWTNFAKTGNPNKESPTSAPYTDDLSWPPFTIPELQYKELAVNLMTDRAVKADICHFWNNYLPKLQTFSAELEETEREWREEFYSWKYTDMEDWRHAFKEYSEALNQ